MPTSGVHRPEPFLSPPHLLYGLGGGGPGLAWGGREGVGADGEEEQSARTSASDKSRYLVIAVEQKRRLHPMLERLPALSHPRTIQ